VKRYWYVFSLDVLTDPNAPIFAQVNDEVPVQPVAANPLRRNRNFDFEPVVLQPAGDYGFKIAAATYRNMNQAFTSRKAAQLWAKEQAEKNPKVMYGIYECVQVFETTTPTIIEKKFNDAGELIPVV